jgi:hypothetical protein
VLAIEKTDRITRVVVLPITHSIPRPPDEGIELPPETGRRLGLDSERSWISVSDANDFVWPGPDVRFLPGQGPASVAYGFLPPGVFRVVRERFLARLRARKGGIVSRSS